MSSDSFFFLSRVTGYHLIDCVSHEVALEDATVHSLLHRENKVGLFVGSFRFGFRGIFCFLFHVCFGLVGHGSENTLCEVC